MKNVAEDPDGSPEDHRVECHLDDILTQKGMTLAALSEKADISVANLSILKNNRARAVRFTTLTSLCDVLDCQPGDLISIRAASDV